MKPGNIIKNRRIEKGLTQDELGDLVGVQKSAIAKYENGVIENLKRSTILKLSEALDLTPTQIMGFEKEQNEIPDKFTTVKDAMEFLLNQTVVMGFNGLDISKLSEEDQVNYANEVLNMMKLVSLKYKDKNK